jgi:hypothetical protein
MKYILFLAFGFISAISIAQNRDNTKVQANWDNIVDHSNVVLTSAYIQNLADNKNLNKEDLKDFNTERKDILETSTLQDPIDFTELKNHLNTNFKKTFNSLSIEIDNLKSKTKNIDTLYAVLSKSATDVRMDSSALKSTINELKSEIEQFVAVKEVDTINESYTLIQESTHENASVPERGESIFTLTNFLILGILLLIIIFIYSNSKNSKKIRRLYRELELKRENERFDTIKNQGNRINSRDKKKINSLEKEIVELRKRLNQEKFKISNSPITPIRKVQFKNPTPSISPTQKQSPTLYAGKPNPDKVFSQVSNNIDEQQSIYKLSLDNNNPNEAKYEVIIASDFMKRQIINTPDDFLYRVCNHENSNQDFQKEITTLKKGTAKLIDGQWSVSENDKALIKFQ